MPKSTLISSQPRNDAQSVKVLQRRYILVMVVVAVLIVFGRAVALAQLSTLQGANELINAAGRQSMLSQRLAKEAYMMVLQRENADETIEHREHIASSRSRWIRVQSELQSGISGLPFSPEHIAAIQAGFADAEPHLNRFLAALDCVEHHIIASSIPCTDTLEISIAALDRESDAFLGYMDDIVNTYSLAADATETRLTYIGLASAGIVLVLLVAASLSIFQPAVRKIGAAFQALNEAQSQLQEVNTSLEARVQERTRALERTNRMLQTTNEDLLNFTSIITHDLRSPIASIKGFLKEIQTDLAALKPVLDAGQQQRPDEEARTTYDDYLPDALGAMREAVEKSERLLRGIVEIARDRNRPYRMEVLDTQRAIETVLASLAYDIRSQGANITVAPHFPPIAADALAFEQIMSNLVGNSLKYRDPARTPAIEIRWAQEDTRVTISVQDNGRGIPQDEQSRVFQLFRRGSNTEMVEGLGMGLYHIRNLVRRHGGEMQCRSEVDAGSTFSFTMPLASAAEPPTPPSDTSEMRTIEAHERTLAAV